MKCPICKRPVPAPDPNAPGPYPFCSERCKLIDLGRWLDGKYQIPVVEEGDEASHEGREASASADRLRHEVEDADEPPESSG
jgi:endogenous inhibitor of DNA gyrase (YacG/DUF329 family)